jgi:hypothetical protein
MTTGLDGRTPVVAGMGRGTTGIASTATSDAGLSRLGVKGDVGAASDGLEGSVLSVVDCLFILEPRNGKGMVLLAVAYGR